MAAEENASPLAVGTRVLCYAPLLVAGSCPYLPGRVVSMNYTITGSAEDFIGLTEVLSVGDRVAYKLVLLDETGGDGPCFFATEVWACTTPTMARVGMGVTWLDLLVGRLETDEAHDLLESVSVTPRSQVASWTYPHVASWIVRRVFACESLPRQNEGSSCSKKKKGKEKKGEAPCWGRECKRCEAGFC
jgi:hypothetical protein